MSVSQNIITDLSKDKLTIKAQSTQTVNFLGASPNYYRITNGGDTALYLGVSMMPTEHFFDEKIPSGVTKLFVDAYGHDEIYIYNPSVSDSNIVITSFSAPFEPSVLAMCGVGQDFSNIELSGSFDATGDMKTFLKNINDNIDDNIGFLYNIHDILKNQQCTIIRQETNTANDITLKMFHIELLSNDSDSDMNIKINNVNFTLKSGEVLNKIHFTRQSSIVIPKNASFRVIGG